MEWIYGSHIICTHHIMECELKPVDDKTCILHVTIQRTLRNISKNKEGLPLSLEIDEWFQESGSSKILSFGYIKSEEKWPEDGVNFKVKKGARALATERKIIPLNPNDEVITRSEFEEIKRTNDSYYMVFRYPTRDPQVTVKAYEGIHIEGGFGYREPEAKKLGNNTYMLKGTLLPYQIILVRWWEKQEHERWLHEA